MKHDKTSLPNEAIPLAPISRAKAKELVEEWQLLCNDFGKRYEPTHSACKGCGIQLACQSCQRYYLNEMEVKLQVEYNDGRVYLDETVKAFQTFNFEEAVQTFVTSIQQYAENNDPLTEARLKAGIEKHVTKKLNTPDGPAVTQLFFERLLRQPQVKAVQKGKEVYYVA